MLLVYVDDSGNTWETKNGFFKDGPFVIHTGLLVNQEKYFHVERMFYDLASSILGIHDWKKIELHASDIWARKGSFENISPRKIELYFEEFVQMVAKLSLKVVVGVEYKDIRFKSVKRNNTIEYSQYAFLHTLEHQLSRINETAVIISDLGDKIKSLGKLLYLKTQWRYNPDDDKRKIRFLSKFKYESQSCFILDQMHFVESKDSLFIQIIDHLAFIFNRVLTYCFLKYFPIEGLPAKPELVPVTPTTFGFYASSGNLLFGNFDKMHKDIMMGGLEHVSNSKDYLSREYISNLTLNK